MRGTATPLREGPFSLTLPDSAGLPTIPSQGGGGLSNNLLPWLVNVDVYMTSVSATNWNTLTLNASQINNGNRTSSGAQNDEVSFDVVLAAGTWTFELIHVTDADTGTYSVQLAGTEKGTIDGYSASTVHNARNQITGIAVNATGKIRLTLAMSTKNASSSNYFGRIQHLQFKRTA